MKRILITGGAGFIGSHTVDLLLQQGLSVVVLDNLSSGKLSNLNLFHPNMELVKEDILNYPVLAKTVARCDAVLHLAAIPSVPQSMADPIQTHRVNSLGFLHVLEAIRQCQRPIRLVYASSAAVYGNTEQLPCSDEKPLMDLPASPYALEKIQNEQYAELYSRLFGANALGLRYFNVYGLRQDAKSTYSGVISRFMAGYKGKEPLLVFGDGKQSRDFVSVADVAQANWLALQSDYCGTANIATGAAETLLNLLKYIESAGTEPALIHHAPARQGDIYASYATTNKAEQKFGFRYKVPLADGIKLMMAQK